MYCGLLAPLGICIEYNQLTGWLNAMYTKAEGWQHRQMARWIMLARNDKAEVTEDGSVI
jgi:hypothetical protein